MSTADASTGRMASITERLSALASIPGGLWSITFLDSNGEIAERRTAPELQARVATVAAFLERETAPGEPVLLVFQPCIDFLTAFLACQWAGRLAVPINPPRRHRLIERLQAVAADSGARVAVTGGGLADTVRLWQAESAVLAAIRWQDLAPIADDRAAAIPRRTVDPEATCFIQYTSGSTALPKGVEVSHRNLIADMALMEAAWGLTPASTMVTWLPAFHDLGLIFGLLQPLFSGCPVVQMAPNSFLQRPALWLQAISRFRGTHTAAPSFAYDLCNRRIAPAQRQDLDLSSLVMAMNAAEPINPEVMDAFVEAFGPHGFRRSAFSPAYGLAESTLAVTANPAGMDPLIFHLDAAALKQGQIAEAPQTAAKRVLVGCGAPLPDVPIAIVDPQTERRQPPGEVGEIWVGGPTIARGYWRRPDESATTFGARISGEDESRGYLRTGDLGAMIGNELCVTGRIKDLIILSGANHYPQDVERVAQAAHPAMRIGNGAAFGVSNEHGAEQVVLVQELERTQRRADPEPLFRAISNAVWQELEVQLSHIVLVEPGGVLRTSSGKVQRAANQRAWRAGELPVVAEWHSAAVRAHAEVADPAPAKAPGADDPAALTRWLRRWLAAKLGLAETEVTSDRGFGELGLASIDAVELAGALTVRCGRELPETVAFDFPTVRALVEHLCGSQPQSMATLPTPPSAAGHGGDLEELLAMIEGDSGGLGSGSANQSRPASVETSIRSDR